MLTVNHYVPLNLALVVHGARYGVDDSVGLAIFLENRYKVLRSPHKPKMAVSGLYP